MANIKIQHKSDDNHVKVRVESTASLTAIADEARDLSTKEFKKLIQLVNLYRKADKKADKWAEVLDDLIIRSRSISDKEWKSAVKLSKTLRQADKDLAEARKVESHMKERRFNQAQIAHA